MRRRSRPERPSFRRRLPAGRDLTVPTTWNRWKAQHAGRPWYVRYPLAIEWGLEWFYHRLRGLALFDLLELAGRCTVLVVAVFWLLEMDDRTKERHYRAWDLINSARGSTGAGGRKDALEDLNRDGVSLVGAPLETAFLLGIDLKGAVLVEANLERAILEEANLEGADLAWANLKGTNLAWANLEGAVLVEANLERATLWKANLKRTDLGESNLHSAPRATPGNRRGANLQRADLRRANLEGAYLGEADLEGAYLEGAHLAWANLKGTNLAWANLKGTNLAGANLEGASLLEANLEGAKNLEQEQLDAAIGNERTQLPEGLTRPAHWSTAGAAEPPSSKE